MLEKLFKRNFSAPGDFCDEAEESIALLNSIARPNMRAHLLERCIEALVVNGL